MGLVFQTKETGYCTKCGTVHSGSCPRKPRRKAEAVR